MTTEQNQFNPDWDAMAVMLEEQQRMAKRIEELEAQQCKYPICQSDEYQQLLVLQIKRELMGKNSGQYRPVPQFTTSVRKMWSGSEVQRWINENWNKIPD